MVKTFNLFLKIGLVILTAFLIAKFTTNKIEYHKTNPYNSTPITMVERDRQLTCLAKNIYHEAASEPFEGKVAVAQVTINRAESGKFPSDICNVVYQKNVVYGKVICQFSWYCENTSKTRPVHKKLWAESEEAVKMVMIDGFRLPELKDALYYHADYVNPQWNKKQVAKIGRHIFYKDKV